MRFSEDRDVSKNYPKSTPLKYNISGVIFNCLLFNGTVAGCGSLSGGRLRRVARGREAEGAEGRSEARDFSARRARRLGVDEDLRSWVEEPPEVAS